jgi:hypothetical protein
MENNEYLDSPIGFVELDMSWKLLEALRSLKVNDPIRGREWAIAVTEAEKLYAWLVYVAEMMPKDDRQ